MEKFLRPLNISWCYTIIYQGFYRKLWWNYARLGWLMRFWEQMEYFELSDPTFNLTFLAARTAAANNGLRMASLIIAGAVKTVPANISRRAMAIQLAMIRAWQILNKLSTCFCFGFGYTIYNWYNKSLLQNSGVWYQVDGWSSRDAANLMGEWS